MLMVENSTKTKELNEKDGQPNTIEENDIAEAFEEKLKNCIQQLSKDPSDKTIRHLLHYSRTIRNV